MGDKDNVPSGEWNPFQNLGGIARSIDRAEGSPKINQVGPVVNLRESPKEIVVSAEIPGFERDDIQVDLSEEMITIRGERGAEQGERGKIRSASFESFIKTLRLPAPVKADKAKASLKDGLLEITLTKLRRKSGD